MKFFVFIFFIYLCILNGQSRDLSLADMNYSKGNYEKVIEILDNNLIEDSIYSDYWYKLGISYQRLNNYGRAHEALYTAYKFSKFDFSLNIALGRNYYYSGAYNSALLFFRQAYEIDSSNLSLLIDLANCFSEINEYENAIHFYRELITRDSTNAYFYSRIGKCYYKINEDEQALFYLRKAFNKNPHDAATAILLGGLLVNNNDFIDALKVIHQGLNFNGQSFSLLKLSAETLFKMKRYEDAAVQYEAIISAGDSTSTNYKKLGFCRYLPESIKGYEENSKDTTKYLSAIDSFSKAIRKDSTDALSHIYLGICLKERSEYSKSTAFINKGIKLTFPDYLADAYSQLASAYEFNGQYSEAIRAYKKAHDHDPQRRSITFQLASLYDRYYGDKQTPLLYYKKFLSESGNADTALINYAIKRIDYLIEQKHFHN